MGQCSTDLSEEVSRILYAGAHAVLGPLVLFERELQIAGVARVAREYLGWDFCRNRRSNAFGGAVGANLGPNPVYTRAIMVVIPRALARLHGEHAADVGATARHSGGHNRGERENAGEHRVDWRSKKTNLDDCERYQ